jgi:hypothetical protein
MIFSIKFHHNLKVSFSKEKHILIDFAQLYKKQNPRIISLRSPYKKFTIKNNKNIFFILIEYL